MNISGANIEHHELLQRIDRRIHQLLFSRTGSDEWVRRFHRLKRLIVYYGTSWCAERGYNQGYSDAMKEAIKEFCGGRVY